MAHKSETTDRTELISELNARLPRPYKAYNSIYVTMPDGGKREFDVIIADEHHVSKRLVNADRVEVVIETKAPGGDVLGIDQAEDAFTGFPGLVATFATNFGNRLYKRSRDQPGEHVEIKSDDPPARKAQIADHVVGVLKSTLAARESKGVTFTEQEVIATIKECMETVQQQMTELSDADRTSIMDQMTWKTPSTSDAGALTLIAKRAASYIIVNQLMFYHLLQTKSKRYKLRPLKPLDEDDKPKQLGKYIVDVMEETGDFYPVFKVDMLLYLPQKKGVTVALNKVIATITRAKFDLTTADFIGKVFHHIIPYEIRKPIAAYYTGNAPARLLATLAITEPGAVACDLACGSGTLLLESYNRKSELHKKINPGKSNQEIHQQVMGEIYGNDITPIATHLAAMNLAMQNLEGETSKINISCSDGLRIMPNKPLDKLIGIKSEEQGVQMGERTNKVTFPDKVDCVIMNPPFSQRGDMSEEITASIDKLSRSWFSSEKEAKKYINRNMGLNGYFLLHADHLLVTKGTIAMVLSTATFNSGYSKKILAYLQDKQYNIEYVMEIRTQRSAFSEDCAFAEYIVILKKGLLNPGGFTNLVSFGNEFALDDVPQLLNAIKSNTRHPNVIQKVAPTAQLYASNSWSKLFGDSIVNIDALLELPKLERYNENTSQIKILRGFDGTYAEYLMLPNDEWAITPNIVQDGVVKNYIVTHVTLPEGDEQRSCILPAQYCLPALRGSESVTSQVVPANSFVLDLPHVLPRELDDFSRNYLHWARNQVDKQSEKDASNGHKRVEVPGDWYCHAHDDGCYRKKGNVFGIRKYRPARRAVLWTYSKDVITINHSFGYILTSPNDSFYSSWMNSALYLYQAFNNHKLISRGYFELPSGKIDNIKFPVYVTFDETAKTELVSRWQSLANVKDLPFLPGQFGLKITKKKGQAPVIERCSPVPERVALDAAWLRALGVNETDIPAMLDELYEWLRKYLSEK